MNKLINKYVTLSKKKVLKKGLQIKLIINQEYNICTNMLNLNKYTVPAKYKHIQKKYIVFENYYNRASFELFIPINNKINEYIKSHNKD